MKPVRGRLDRAGALLVDGFQLAGLFVVGATAVWAAGHERLRMTGESLSQEPEVTEH